MKIKNAKKGMRVQVKSDISKSLELHGNIPKKANTVNKYGEILRIRLDRIRVHIDGGYTWTYVPEDLRIADKKRKCKHGSECKNFEPVETFDWPDSFEDAKKESWYWGFEGGDERYMICMDGPAHGLAVNPAGIWSDSHCMKYYWKKAITAKYRPLENYHFVKFNTKKELYQWLLDGEE